MEPAHREPLQMVTHPLSSVHGCYRPTIAVSPGRSSVETSDGGSRTAGHGQLADAVQTRTHPGPPLTLQAVSLHHCHHPHFTGEPLEAHTAAVTPALGTAS